jgi:hypothetical protein
MFMQNIIYLLPIFVIIALLVIVGIGIFISNADDKKVKGLLEEIENESPFRKSDPSAIRPHNDPLARNKVYEKRRQEELESNVTIYDPKGLQKQNLHEETQIVGLVEPKGFWSRFVMSQKLGYIMARLNFQNNKSSGFWTNLIKAQAASQGKSQGRGR